MTLQPRWLLLFAGLGVAAWFAFGGGRPGRAGQPPVDPVPAGAPAAAAQKAPEERASDRDGIQKALDALAAGFRAGDAKAVAGQWAAEGEYIGDDGTALRGRAALEKAYTELFARSPNNALEVEVDQVRFPSRDTAVVEGHFKLRKGPKKELTVSRCSFLYAREDGRWLIAIAREWPGDGLSLRDLEWLIGTWEAKRDGTAVSTTYEWTANKAFIRCQFTITHEGKVNSGTQMIGKDPATGGLRVWTFEDEGGIGDTELTRDGKKWVFTARGVTADGRVLTATNLMTPLDADAFLWHSVGRALDGEALPDLPPIKVTRTKAKP